MQQDLKKIFGAEGDMDDKSLDFLTKALEKNNLKGFDYLEFKMSLARLEGLNMTGEMAIKSAFATASTVGLTREVLVSSARHYQQVLAKEHEEFKAALQNQLNRKVKGKQEEVEAMKNQIREWQEQIEKLKKQISKYQATIDGADQKIREEMDKIERTRDNFESTHKSLMAQIDEDLRRVQEYL